MIKSYPIAVYLRMLARLALGGILSRLRRVQAGLPRPVCRTDRGLRADLAVTDPASGLGADRP